MNIAPKKISDIVICPGTTGIEAGLKVVGSVPAARNILIMTVMIEGALATSSYCRFDVH